MVDTSMSKKLLDKVVLNRLNVYNLIISFF